MFCLFLKYLALFTLHLCFIHYLCFIYHLNIYRVVIVFKKLPFKLFYIFNNDLGKPSFLEINFSEHKTSEK